MKTYKVGDTVKIRSDLANFERLDNCLILSNMKELAGKTAIIKRVNSSYKNRYFIDIEGSNWTSEMFESADAKISFNYLIL